MPCALLIATALFVTAAPASAQFAASMTVTSDDLFRGESISNGNPALIGQLSWDGASGFYAAADAAVELGDPGLRPVNVRGNVGYAIRVGPGTTFDIGVIRSHYAGYGGYGRYGESEAARHYTELYTGIIARRASFHLHFSPDYLSGRVSTLYGDGGVTLSPAPDWQTSAHVGVLARLSPSLSPGCERTRLDWQLGLARQLGRLTLETALNGRQAQNGCYGDDGTNRSRFVVSLTRAL